MRALEVIQPLWVLLALAIGLVLVALLYAAFVVVHRERQPGEEREEQFPAGIRETHYGVPPVLKLIYILVALGAVGQLLWVWLSGASY